MTETYPIIGMSPGNSYFKDDEVEYLLRTTVSRFGKTAILIADIPAIATYLAYGYPENRARNKAIPKGNNLKNRSIRIAEKLGIRDKVRIIDWQSEVENNQKYKEIYDRVEKLYNTSSEFQDAVDETTSGVLEGSGHDIPNMVTATKVAVHYLLSELAFLEFAPELLHTSLAIYVYHRNWPVYERYISGIYDKQAKSHLDFLLLEHPAETYRPLATGSEQMQRINSERILRCAFSNYPPGFIEDEETGEFSGVFHDLIHDFAKEKGWEIVWAEEVGYGVIQVGLDEGRYDVFVAPVWPTPERLRIASFSDPIYFSDVGVWVREEDAKRARCAEFKTNSFVRVAIKEGDITDSIARADFPEWRPVRVPQLTDTEELLRFVADGDADVTFAEQFLANLFNTKSTSKLINAVDKPLRIFPNCFMLSSQNIQLLTLLNAYLKECKSAGMVDQLLSKYAPNYKTQGIILKNKL